MQKVLMLSVITLSVIMLSVVMLSVVAPMKGPLVINKSHLEGSKKLSLCLIATNYYLIVTSEASPACLPMPPDSPFLPTPYHTMTKRQTDRHTDR
jgi:hypothetical protein